MPINVARHPLLRGMAGGLIGAINTFRPAARRARETSLVGRARAERLFADICRPHAGEFDGTVLIDGQFDNPNFWFRLTILRAALGLPNGREIGLLGRHRHAEGRTTFNRFGIRRTVDLTKLAVDRRTIRAQRESLLANSATAEDILQWDLPGGVPGTIFYDTILKAQRLATVDIHSHDFGRLVEEGLTAVCRFQRVLDENPCDLVIVSHAFSYNYGALASLALSRGIPVILPFGWLGVMRLSHMTEPSHLTAFWEAPTAEEMDRIPTARAERLRRVGRSYIDQRLSGKANDVQAAQAFARPAATIDRTEMCHRFNWDPGKPVIGVYASNWFDWPHQLGMTEFRDFLDWTTATFETAARNDRVNWLFKPHPCEQLFGGIALSDILKRHNSPSHVRLADWQWNNAHVLRAIDALVSYHGTAGIEIACLGKPVLLPDRGKYDRSGFARLAGGRADFLSLLQTDWWEGMDLERAQKYAEIYAGICFCAPDWQTGFILGDDPRQDALYPEIAELIERNRSTLEREILSTRDWLASGTLHSHTYKMLNADDYILSNVVEPS